MSEKNEVKLTDKLRKEGEQKARARQAKEVLQENLKILEEKLLIGGLMMDKAAQQSKSYDVQKRN